MTRALPVLLFSIASACAALEASPNPPGPLPHGGVGEFRPLSAAETGVRGSPTGRALPVRDAFDSGAVGGDHLFYASAALPAGAPDPTIEPVAGEVSWADFEPRRIFRSPPNELPGFFIGTEVLAATQPWQGAALFHPWPLQRTDGSALLYYATDGGIGVAEASAIDGAFSPVGDGPVLGDVGGVLPRRPSAVELAGRVLVYFEAAGRIGLASSADGRALELVTAALDLGADLLADDSPEVEVGAPGAAVVQTQAGRHVLRLYFESRRADGRRVTSLAASEDGERFERFERPVLGDEDRMFPSPVVVDSRTTLLYVTAPREQDGREVNGLVATVAPRSVTFAAAE